MHKLMPVHVVAALSPHAGGPSRTVVRLCDSLRVSEDLDVVLVSQNRRGGHLVASTSQVTRRVPESRSRIALSLGLPVLSGLNDLVRQSVPSLIHNHGVWLPVNHWAARVAQKNDIPLVIHPRGMLEPWAMEQKSAKKKLALNLFQWKDLLSARLFMASADAEYKSLRDLGLNQPIAIIPNGVDLNLLSDRDIAAAENRRIDRVAQPRTCLFLSRIHPKKGILHLLRAWASIDTAGWRLLLAGPDEGDHLAEVMKCRDDLGLQESVEYLGVVDGESKTSLYRSADLFVLPTYSENFGQVVAEALAQGVPVITTRGAPWADLTHYRCGWWIDLGLEPLRQALSEALTLSDDQRKEMGQRGRKYVSRFNWEDIASQTHAVYRWILGRGDCPDCVRVD